MFNATAGAAGLETAVKALAETVVKGVAENRDKVIILSDRGVSASQVAIPMLLAVGAVHQALIQAGVRVRCDLVAETGEAREVHQIACLLGMGVNAVNPYLAFEVISQLALDGKAGEDVTPTQARRNYETAIGAGLRKIMAKMGISTLYSYRGAQIFEALGVSHQVIEDCFFGVPSPIGGVGYQQIGEATMVRHALAFPELDTADPDNAGQAVAPGLKPEGYYRVNKRGEGEYHAWSPKLIASMNKFNRAGTTEAFQPWKAQADEHQPVALKDLLKIRFPENGVDLEEVEGIEDIRKRFTTAGMSMGAL